MPEPLVPHGGCNDDNLLYEILAGLAQCHKHRRWYASFAVPYLGTHPIEIGSGLGDYAREWLPHVERLTLTDSNPEWVEWLTERYSANSEVTVHQLTLPSAQAGHHTSVIA